MIAHPKQMVGKMNKDLEIPTFDIKVDVPNKENRNETQLVI